MKMCDWNITYSVQNMRLNAEQWVLETFRQKFQVLTCEKLKFSVFDGPHYWWKFQDELCLDTVPGVEKDP